MYETLRSLLKRARSLHMTDWELHVDYKHCNVLKAHKDEYFSRYLDRNVYTVEAPDNGIYVYLESSWRGYAPWGILVVKEKARR